ncbi:replication initiation regulator SeqA [Photorhabdus luminescens]|uniref:Negative modulator of initiation of replication n=4 Tax=Photorhabdus TaxID=29487 RepID=A0A0A0CLP0_9GAMM|nr:MULTISPECIES: replication initiation negative regulator SeqA [Photorhabdus]KGM26824.1 replication initiation regulator SeqA [Photorhabdus luminescens]EYU13518.1 negative regulator of replication initiation SeqA [Photorhabdus aegyptia]MBS9434641.1 replication initiation negative regulator SeqA [Photorhabdus hainanensis]MCC8460203.1 replication initiation negative regulator SeqA [Photorhabdus aegyptia]OCA54542.1 Negative modulator of initiation of replication [Photorhabdus namnaonensis]
MKTIEVDEDLYRYIASHTQHIGESASDILRRMLKFNAEQPVQNAQPISAVEKAPVARQRDSVRVMRELLLSDDYSDKKKSVERFMLILSTLYSLNSESFSQTTDAMHGRTRVYFAGDQQTLLASGKQTKPRHIPGTPFWVITNTNTDRKRNMVEQIMQDMKFSANFIDKVCGTI